MTLVGKIPLWRINYFEEVGLSSARVMVADAKGGWKLGTGIEFTAQVESYDLQF
jgi:hypothetical protein